MPTADHYLRGAVEVPPNRTLVVIGAQSPLEPNGELAPDAAGQCAAIWAKLVAALAEKGLEPRHIVALETDLASRRIVAAARAEQARHLRHHVAETVRIVALAEAGWLAQVSALAAVTR